MRVLAITNLFPNANEPHAAPFNRQQFKALSALCKLDLLGTVGWFPGARAFPTSLGGRLWGVPRREVIDGLAVRHPRYLYTPKLGYGAMGWLYAGSLAPIVWRYRGRVDALLAAWAYPDGFAGVLLARLLGVPAVIKCHGSDINCVAQLWGPRLNLRWALQRARRVVTVSRDLARSAVVLGARPSRVQVVLNGVDTALFHPRPRRAARRRMGLPSDRPIITFVGALSREKGLFELLRAAAALRARGRSPIVACVGEGPRRDAAVATARQLGVDARFVGQQPLADVPRWIAAGDVVALPSWAEGTPNVLLEALACGRRVVATDVGGIPELVRDPLLGELVPPREVDRLASALGRALQDPGDPHQIARRSPSGDWSRSARSLHRVLRAAVDEHHGTRRRRAA